MSHVFTHFLEVTAAAPNQADFDTQLEKHKNYVHQLFELILTEDAGSIARLETELEVTQMEAVDEFIEDTDWGPHPDLRRFRGGKGTPDKRLEAFRRALRNQGIGLR